MSFLSKETSRRQDNKRRRKYCWDKEQGAGQIEGGGSRQATLKHIVACLLVFDDVLELGLDQLAVVVGD